MFHSITLTLHVLLGACALLLAIAAMRVKKAKGLHTRLGVTYHWLFLCLSVSACVLAAMDWNRLWWFVPVALFSYAFALLGYSAARIRWHNWLRFHVVGQGGSFIAMCTAVLVVNLRGYPWTAWILPTLIGAPILAWFGREIRAGRRPRYD